MKSVTVIPRNIGHAQRVAELFGVPVGQTLEVPMGKIDELITAHLRNHKDAADSATAESQVERIDKTIPLTSEEKTHSLQIQATFLSGSIGAHNEQKQLAYTAFVTARQALRQAVVSRAAIGDVDSDTLVYGLDVPGAILIRTDGIHRSCKTLIHGTHPLSPEEEYLRELQVSCDRIIRYCVPGLDDGEWMRLQQPLRWPLTPQDWRELCILRNRK